MNENATTEVCIHINATKTHKNHHKSVTKNATCHHVIGEDSLGGMTWKLNLRTDALCQIGSEHTVHQIGAAKVMLLMPPTIQEGLFLYTVKIL